VYGRDNSARQSMFATQVQEWWREFRIGSPLIGSGSSFEGMHPLQEQIAKMNRVIAAHPALRSGSQEVQIASGALFIATRTLNNKSYLVGFNGRDASQKINLAPLGVSPGLKVLDGDCYTEQDQPLVCLLPGRSYFVIERNSPPAPTALPTKLKVNWKLTSLPTGWIELSTRIPGKGYFEVSFSARYPGKTWRHLGTADRRTIETVKTTGGLHRVFLHPEEFKKGSTLEVIATVKSADGRIQSSPISIVKL